VSDEKGTPPTVEELRRYLAFESEGGEWGRIGGHLHGCEDCQILLPELPAEIDPGGASDQAQ